MRADQSRKRAVCRFAVNRSKSPDRLDSKFAAKIRWAGRQPNRWQDLYPVPRDHRKGGVIWLDTSLSRVEGEIEVEVRK
jgi:hypothetical protein